MTADDPVLAGASQATASSELLAAVTKTSLGAPGATSGSSPGVGVGSAVGSGSGVGSGVGSGALSEAGAR